MAEKANGKVAWKVREWAGLVSLSPSYVHRLIGENKIASKRIGHTRLITTSPEEFIKTIPEGELPEAGPQA